MACEAELVERVVHMQLCSPEFAAYCVAHVTDPKHRFLFAQKDGCAERNLYIKLLDQHRSSEASSSQERGIHALWSSLPAYFLSSRNVCGPHMPHMFRSKKDLAAFVCMLEDAAVKCDEGSRNKVVQFMLRRLPMTEAFLYIFLYLCDVYVHKARGPSRRRNDGGQVCFVGTASDSAALQTAGTLLFICNVFLLEHEALGPPVRYKCVFETFARRMVELIGKAAPRDSQVAAFLRETVDVWATSRTFSEDTLACMKRAVKCS